ncbi:TPA: extracellular adherence protein Eap/Map [Staphylococcus aureus]|uniref:Extracellular adherence protein Eap/Map n=37 Tax=Staphylococcus aureus TaxID=1280 RepID=A0AAE2ZZL2_STAAU|nr:MULTISPECIES: extracellular adherence protein Eap/Map [Staphylococcus]HDH6201671.1 extracellular adherence protein Eap/Map [Staphylococcus aureus LTCF-15-62]HDH6282224.1 extracellular adherence protein Eap/Map [Staphylococcus aureus LTCF-3-23]HDH6493734.1 extracellular adherence protein Eap/Map [Staphylococcus aureus MRSA-Lux-7]HDK8547008.1 extracellular adherence protein Eap/Map [Staphylococcus aureus subsp. aureus ST22]AHZ99785.1 membrane protein [Staphylococcus aureus]
MKFKSLITTTLALGVLASTGANFNTNEASAAAKPLDKSSSTLHHGHSKIQVPYTITVNGTSQNILSSLTFNKNQQISYKDLENKVKSVLYFNRGISDIDLRLSKQAEYTVHFKNGTKKVVDLKSGIYTADLINTSDIKAISVNVDTKKQPKDKAKANVQVPYTITVNGTSQNILSSLTFNKNQNVSYKDLEDKVKSVLESNRGITDVDLRLSKQAKFTVNFKNGTKKVIDLKAGIYTANLINSSDIKSININVDTKKHIENKAKRNYQVPYSINLNGTSTNILSNLSFSNKPWTNYKNLTSQIKSVLKHDRGISEQDLKYAKKAYYTVYFKNGGKRVVHFNSKTYSANLVHAKDVKKIEVTVKTASKAKAERYVPYSIAVNGTSTPNLSDLKFTGDPRVGYKDITKKVKSVLKHDRGIGERELKYAKKATYTVHFKNGKKKVINLNSKISQLNLLYVQDIKKIDIDVKTGSKAKADSYVPYTIAVNGTSTHILSKLKISNKQLIGYQDLNEKVKSVLKHDRGINDIELKFAKQAKYTIHFKNGKTQVVDLKSDIFTRNLFSAKDIKKIDIDVKQHTKSKKINKSNNVKFPVTINKFENIVSNEFVFYNASKITINDLSTKLKSAMANDQGITKHDIGLAERAVYKVYFKNGSSKYVDLKTEYKDRKVFKATDIKKVDIELKF